LTLGACSTRERAGRLQTGERLAGSRRIRGGQPTYSGVYSTQTVKLIDGERLPLLSTA
jgi:hypothetical protein